MFDTTLSEEETAVEELARELAKDQLGPAARAAEDARAVPGGVWRHVVTSGLLVAVPEEWGGDGLPGLLARLVAIESLATGDPAIAATAAWSGFGGALLAELGGEGQSDLLRRLGAGKTGLVAVATFEGFGRSPDEYETVVEPASPTEVRIRGRKTAVAGAAAAEQLLVFARDPDGAARAVLVPTAAAGVTMGDDAGRLAFDAAGWRDVELDTVVPRSALLEADPATVTRAVNSFRLVTAAVQIGTAARAIEFASAYAVDREAFGRPIAGFEGVSFLLADGHIALTQARVELRGLAARAEEAGASPATGQADDAEAAGTFDATAFEDAVTSLVTHAGESAAEITRNAVQVLGGHGFITDYPVELWYRSAAALYALDSDPLRSSFHPAF